MKWILPHLFLGIILYWPVAWSSENTLEVQKDSSCTYFSHSKISSDHQTEAQAVCVQCPPGPTQPPLSLVLLPDIKESVANQPCCFVYAPSGVQSSDRLKNGGLSFYWAQELIGSDLLKKELKNVSHLPKNFIAVFDTDAAGNDCAVHTEQVESLISDQGRHAILPELGNRLKFYYTVRPIEYRDTSLNMLNNAPHFINNSMSWRDDSIMYQAVSRLSPPSVMIVSAGNDYPTPMNPFKIKTSQDLNTILVGNLSSEGLVNELSQAGSEVHILAPAGRELTSADDQGAYCKFGGTSGAAPLVTGSLAAFEWISGYHPTAEEAKILLEKTAIPTVHSVFENPRRNGHGLLNTYKLGRLAKWMKEQCGQKPESEKNQCFKQKIRNDNTYRVSIKKEAVYKHINNAFPECNDKEDPPVLPYIPSCEEKQKALKALRASVLLDPHQADLWKVLSCIYRNQGFTQNAKMLDRIHSAVTQDKNFVNQLFAGGVEDQVQWVRLASHIGGEENKKKLNQLVYSEDTSVQVKTAIIQSSLFLKESFGVEKAVEFLTVYAKDASPLVREQTARVAGLLEGKEGEEVIRSLFEDRNFFVKEAAYRAALQKGMSDGISRLNALIQSGEDPDLIKGIMDWIKEKEGRQEILNLLNLNL